MSDFCYWRIFINEDDPVKILKRVNKSFNNLFKPTKITINVERRIPDINKYKTTSNVVKINDYDTIKKLVAGKIASLNLKLKSHFKGFKGELMLTITNEWITNKVINIRFTESLFINPINDVNKHNFNKFFNKLKRNVKAHRVMDVIHIESMKKFIKKYGFKALNLINEEGFNFKPVIKGLEFIEEYRRSINKWESLVFDEWLKGRFLEEEDYDNDLAYRSIVKSIENKINGKSPELTALKKRLKEADKVFKSITKIDKRVKTGKDWWEVIGIPHPDSDWWFKRIPKKKDAFY